MDWSKGLAIGMAIPGAAGFALVITKTTNTMRFMGRVNAEGKKVYEKMRRSMHGLEAAERDFQLVVYDMNGSKDGDQRRQAIRCLEWDIDECSTICSEYEKLHDKVSSSLFKTWLWNRKNKDLDLSYGALQDKIKNLQKSVELAKLISSSSPPGGYSAEKPQHEQPPSYSQEDVLGCNGVEPRDFEHPPALPQRPRQTFGNPASSLPSHANNANHYGQGDRLVQFRDRDGNPVYATHITSYRYKLKAKRIAGGAAAVGAGVGFVVAGPAFAIAAAGGAVAFAIKYVDHRRARGAR